MNYAPALLGFTLAFVVGSVMIFSYYLEPPYKRVHLRDFKWFGFGALTVALLFVGLILYGRFVL